MNCSLSFWKRPRTASANLPSTSTWRSRERCSSRRRQSAHSVPGIWRRLTSAATPELRRAGVAEQAAEDVGEEVGQQLGFLELVGAAGSDEVGPVLELGLPGRHVLRQVERPHLLAHDFRVEERFGFDGHGDLRFTIYDLRAPGRNGVSASRLSASAVGSDRHDGRQAKLGALIPTRHGRLVHQSRQAVQCSV